MLLPCWQVQALEAHQFHLAAAKLDLLAYHDISHILWKIKFMFQTTNQILDILRTIVEILLIYDLWRSNYFLLYHGALHGPIIKCLPTSLP